MNCAQFSQPCYIYTTQAVVSIIVLTFIKHLYIPYSVVYYYDGFIYCIAGHNYIVYMKNSLADFQYINSVEHHQAVYVQYE